MVLVNARHVKNVPGRKTDVQDSEWLCKQLRSGLMKGSFIPAIEVRELRDLTRYKRKLIQNVTSETPNAKQLDRANEIVDILTNTTKSLFSNNSAPN
jgi:transposase